MKTVVIDYGSGNLRSAAKALERAAHEEGIETDIAVTDDPAALDAADRVVLPGVGAFGDCAAGLCALPGMITALERNVREYAKPFLGICVGMQLMADRGVELGTYDGFGWLPGEVCPVEPSDPSLKIPHMGWNRIKAIDSTNRHPLLRGVEDGAHVYFVHSFYAGLSADTIASCHYGTDFTAIAGNDNFMGCQFHPERSGPVGEQILKNFLAL